MWYSMWGFPIKVGVPFWGPYNMDYSMLELEMGFPCFWKLPCGVVYIVVHSFWVSYMFEAVSERGAIGYTYRCSKSGVVQH